VTTDFENIVEDVAKCFSIGNPANTKAIEPAIDMIKQKCLDTNVLVLRINDTVSKYHRKQISVC